MKRILFFSIPLVATSLFSAPRNYNHPSKAEARHNQRIAQKYANLVRRPVEIKATYHDAAISKGVAALLIVGLATAMIPGVGAADINLGCSCGSGDDCTVKKCSLVSECLVKDGLGYPYCYPQTHTCWCHVYSD